MRDLQTDWTYRPSPIAPRVHLKRLKSWVTGRQAPPSFQVVLPLVSATRWNALFLFAPAGELDRDQYQMLERVRALNGSMLVVLASPDANTPAAAAVMNCADALIIKGLNGFDFSAYRIALEEIARHSPGAIAYVQNDSVFGPLCDLDSLISSAPWDLTGFIGMRAVENHISSFAFILRDVTPARVAALQPVLSPSWSCDRFEDVILLQETCLARIASRSMSVGAYWYVPTHPPSRPLLASIGRKVMRLPPPADITGDATIASPMGLLDAGFPYLKRSLFTKFAGLHNPAHLIGALELRGWQTANIQRLTGFSSGSR